MQRRTFLKLGIGSAVVLAAAGGAVALLQPGLVKGKLSDPARLVLRRVAQAMLVGSLPAANSTSDARDGPHDRSGVSSEQRLRKCKQLGALESK